MRITLTSKQAATGSGQALCELANNVLADGKLTAEEARQLQDLIQNTDAPIAAVAFLREELSRYSSDGTIYPWELGRLQLALERILPAPGRAIARAARKQAEKELQRQEDAEPPDEVERQWKQWEHLRGLTRADLTAMEPASDAQRKYIAHLGGDAGPGMTKGEASELINGILAEQDIPESEPRVLPKPQRDKDTPLWQAVRKHEERLRVEGKQGVEITIPSRQPYEGKATLKQKDYLWNLGLTDTAIIDSLGKWQASAVIDQLTAAPSSSGAGLVIALLVVVVVIIAAAVAAS